MTEQLPEEIIEAIDLTREIADQLDRRRREPSNIAAAATIACWYLGSGQLEDISEGLNEIGLVLIEAFGGDEDDAEEEEGDPEGYDETEDEGFSGGDDTAADPYASHTFNVGDTIKVKGLTGTGTVLNGTYVVTAKDADADPDASDTTAEQQP